MKTVKDLEILNDCEENRKLIEKLPERLRMKWLHKVTDHREQNDGAIPSFQEYANFIGKEARMMNDPLAILTTTNKIEAKSPKGKNSASASQTKMEKDTGATDDNNKNRTVCLCCKKSNHDITDCFFLSKKSKQEQKAFILQNNLCFKCLDSSHQASSCNNPQTCKRCGQSHPTSLHVDSEGNSQNTDTQEKLKEASTLVCGSADASGKRSTMVVPVWLSGKDEKEILVYALLDTQSDATFITEEVWQQLETDSVDVMLRLSTMAKKSQLINTRKVQGLTVRGFRSAERISLPATYTRPFIPFEHKHVPDPDQAKAWTHLEHRAAARRFVTNEPRHETRQLKILETRQFSGRDNS